MTAIATSAPNTGAGANPELALLATNPATKTRAADRNLGSFCIDCWDYYCDCAPASAQPECHSPEAHHPHVAKHSPHCWRWECDCGSHSTSIGHHTQRDAFIAAARHYASNPHSR